MPTEPPLQDLFHPLPGIPIDYECKKPAYSALATHTSNLPPGDFSFTQTNFDSVRPLCAICPAISVVVWQQTGNTYSSRCSVPHVTIGIDLHEACLHAFPFTARIHLVLWSSVWSKCVRLESNRSCHGIFHYVMLCLLCVLRTRSSDIPSSCLASTQSAYGRRRCSARMEYSLAIGSVEDIRILVRAFPWCYRRPELAHRPLVLPRSV